MPKCPFCGKNEIKGLQLENHISLKHSEKLLEIQTNLQRNMKGDEKLKVKVQIVVDGNNVAYFGGNPKLRNLKIMRSYFCLLYTSPSPRDVEESRMPSSA